MPAAEKEVYVQEAAKEAIEHKKMYPDYKYMPRRTRKTSSATAITQPTGSTDSPLVQDALPTYNSAENSNLNTDNLMPAPYKLPSANPSRNHSIISLMPEEPQPFTAEQLTASLNNINAIQWDNIRFRNDPFDFEHFQPDADTDSQYVDAGHLLNHQPIYQ